MKHIKISIAIALVAIFFCIPLFSAEIDMYWELYRFSDVWQDKLNTIKEVVANSADDTSNKEFFISVLNDILLKAESAKNSTDKKLWDQCAGIVADRMAKLKNVASETQLWQLYEIADEASVKAGILESLSELPSQQYYSRIINILHDINETPGSDQIYSEKIAYSAITALGKYGNESAYNHVFIAYCGWYTNQTKNHAFETLPLLSQSPANHLIEIINDESTSQLIKSVALDTAIRKETGLTSEDRIKVAIAAYTQCQRIAPIDTKGKDIKRTTADRSIRVLIEEQDHSLEAVPLLKESTRTIYGSEEQLIAIEALGINATDEATLILADLLTALNTKRVDGNFGDYEYLFVRTLLPALGNTKNSKGYAAVWTVTQISTYTNTVKRMARKALKTIPKN